MEIYLTAIESECLEWVETALKIIDFCPFETWTDDVKKAVKKVMVNSNQFFSKGALSICSNHPERVAYYMDEILFNLDYRRDQCHFNAVRIFWSDNVPEYPQILPLLDDVLDEHDDDSMVSDMVRDIQIRYGVLTKEDVENQKTQRKDALIEALRRCVAGMDATELHEEAEGHNWDDGIDFLKIVAGHEKCDLATAKMIYWRGRPHWFTQYATFEEVADHEKDVYQLLSFIEENVKSGQYTTNTLDYSPQNDGGMDFTKNEYDAEVKRKIPDYMYE